MSLGFDALSHPDPGVVKTAGGSFVCGYLKNIHRADIDAVHAHGLGFVAISEVTGRATLGGQAAGAAEAHADVLAYNMLGAPPGAAIYSAEDDYDPTTADLPLILAFMRGYTPVIHAGTYRSGFYGGLAAIKTVLDAGVADFGWQTYAWSGGQWDKRAALQQYLNGQQLGGVGVDYDRSIATSYGAWLPSLPPPPPPLESPDMLIIHDATGDFFLLGGPAGYQHIANASDLAALRAAGVPENTPIVVLPPAAVVATYLVATSQAATVSTAAIAAAVIAELTAHPLVPHA